MFHPSKVIVFLFYSKILIFSRKSIGLPQKQIAAGLIYLKGFFSAP